MAPPAIYLTNTTIFITNLIEEVRVVEANRLSKLENINQLQILSSDIGRIIKKLDNIRNLCTSLFLLSTPPC